MEYYKKDCYYWVIRNRQDGLEIAQYTGNDSWFICGCGMCHDTDEIMFVCLDPILTK